MPKEVVSLKNAPKAIGPYSPAIKAGDFMFVSGQIAIDPTGNFNPESSIEEQTHQIMKNIQAMLKEKNLTLDSIVKTTIFLVNMDEFVKVNEIYGSYFTTKDFYPARTTVAVNLPRKAKIEIEVLVYLK